MFASPSAAPSSKRDCMSLGGPVHVDTDLRQQLIYMQMFIKEIAANVCGLEQGMDRTSRSINSVEQALLQLKQQQQSSLNLVELDNLLKKHIQHALAMQGGNTDLLAKGGSMHKDSLQNIEQGVNDLLAKSMTTGGPLPALPEGKAGAPVINSTLRGEIREELGLLQTSLSKEIKMMQVSLHQDFQQGRSLPTPISPTASLSEAQGSQQVTNPDNISHQLDTLQAVLMNELKTLKAQQDLFECQSKAQTPRLIKGSDVSVYTKPGPKSAESDAAIPEQDVVSLEQEYVSGQSQVEDVQMEKADTVNSEPEFDHNSILLQDNSSLASVFGNETDVESPPYHVEDFFWKTGINQKIARSAGFANFTVVVVVFNAIYIGFDSDYNTAQNIYKADWSFQVCSQFFCLYFTWELVCRFLAFQHKCNCMKDGWFKFDAFLVSTMILDTWVLMTALYIVGGGIKVPTQPLRMLRLFKLTRMARLMKSFPELVTMIKGLIRSLRAISSSMILVGLMVYVWAIMMHMLMKEETEYNETLWRENSLGFGTMTQCIWTLLMAGTMMLDDSSPLMASLLFSDKFNFVLGGFLFVLYTLLSAMCILQMLIGVLCDVVSTVKAEEQSAISIGLLKQEILSSLIECDDGDGKISHDELHTLIHSPHSKALFKKLNVNHTFLVQLMKGMYTKKGKLVPIKEILELMVLCRGDNVTTVETMARALVRIIAEVTDSRVTLEREIQQLQETIYTRNGIEPTEVLASHGC